MEQFDKRLNKKILMVNIVSLFFVLAFLAVLSGILFSKISSPYSKKESAYWLFKNIFGFSQRNAGQVNHVESPFIFNADIEPEYQIVFVGDILPLNKRNIIFSEEFYKFIEDSDYLIANFEGVITDKKKNPSLWNFDLKFEKNILDVFRRIMNPEKVYISVANNHAMDFGRKEFESSMKWLRSAGVKVFGAQKVPYVDLNEHIRIVGATRWSNKKNQGVLPIHEATQYFKEGAFNILYPHFGYEFELYPRAETTKQTEKFLDVFDAVIGHNPSCPQPVTIVSKDADKKLAAYSLGTFFGEVYEKNYQYGLALKVFLGRNNQGKMEVAKIEYNLLKCHKLLNGEYLLEISHEKLGAFNRAQDEKQ